MNRPFSSVADSPRRIPFLLGVFLLTFSVLVFQITQTRILSVIAWYHLAFVAISVAMLGLTAGAVWVYLKRDKLKPEKLSTLLADSSLLTAVTIIGSLIVQFSLVANLTPVVTTFFTWCLLLTAMTVPYIFAGIAISLALTRSPYPIGLVYGVDLLGAALGCAAAVGILAVLDGPSAIILSGMFAALAAYAFSRGATATERPSLKQRKFWLRPLPVTVILLILIPLNMSTPNGLKPLTVKQGFEHSFSSRFEKWNSYSRIVAYPPVTDIPQLWGPSPYRDKSLQVQEALLNIDGAAATMMYKFDGTKKSIEFLKDDIVNLAYYLPGTNKSAVIGVGGGRDLLAAHLFDVKDITGIEVNHGFIYLLKKHPFYSAFANVSAIPNLNLVVDDARSWFASTEETFDLVQMSMIDTWAATGAGAFSLTENGLYTLEGWRAFINRLNDNGIFTVSRWYSPGDVNETGRMVSLAMAAMMDQGVEDPKQHVFVARAKTIATLILSKSPFTSETLKTLHDITDQLGFEVLVSPDLDPDSKVLQKIVSSKTIASLNKAAKQTVLDLSVPTDNRPFFFNQLRFEDIPYYIKLKLTRKMSGFGVIEGNLRASIALVLILIFSIGAVIGTIVLPLRSAAKSSSIKLIRYGTIYFMLIGAGFMLAEISLLQFFGVYLGHPIYAISVCLFSLILSTGLGSLASSRFPINNNTRLIIWGLIVGGYFLLAQWSLIDVFGSTNGYPLMIRILISLAVVMPVGFLMGFAFPTGMIIVEKLDAEPTPWFWGINGATGVLASVLAVMISMAFGINVTMLLAGVCYLALIPTARILLAQSKQALE